MTAEDFRYRIRWLREKCSLGAYHLACRLRGLDLAPVDQEALGLDKRVGNWYHDSGGPKLRAVLRRVPIAPEDVALDVGCGKGGAIITLARYPFRRVDGLELSGELIAVAQRNLRRAGVRCTLHQGDGAQFQALDDYTFFYMYNTFPSEVMRRFMANLEASITARPRRVTLLYKNPVCHDDVVASRSFVESADLGEYRGPTGYT
jgi:SAM-dependent methyltransferase